CHNDVHLQTDQLGDEIGIALPLALRRPIDKTDVLTLDIAEIPHPLYKCLVGRRPGAGQVAYPRDFPRLLRLGGEAVKEHGANSKSNGDFFHHLSVTRHSSLLT